MVQRTAKLTIADQ